MKLELTDTEWMSLIDGERDESALPKCCANISALRDDIIMAARNGGDLIPFNQLELHLNWCFPDHGVPDPVIQKICDQLGIVFTELAPGTNTHEPQGLEV